jgi:hypothetical protein
MQSITQDAQRVSLLFQYGVLDASAVIAWADTAIIQMDSPPDSLLELSTTAPDRTADVLSYLHRLSSGAEFWPALRSAIPQLRDFVVSHPDRAESIANHLFLTVCRFPGPELPDDLHFIYRFDDAFSLAREATYGDTETVYREFVHEMERFTPVA